MRLASGSDLELRRSAEDGDLELGAQGQLGERHGQVAMEIGPVAAEQLVLNEPDEHVEIPGRSPLEPAGALAAQPHLHAVLDAGGNLDLEQAFRALAALAATGLARGLDPLALSPALR